MYMYLCCFRLFNCHFFCLSVYLCLCAWLSVSVSIPAGVIILCLFVSTNADKQVGPTFIPGFIPGEPFVPLLLATVASYWNLVLLLQLGSVAHSPLLAPPPGMDSPWTYASCLKIMKVRFAGCLRLICKAVVGLGRLWVDFLKGRLINSWMNEWMNLIAFIYLDTWRPMSRILRSLIGIFIHSFIHSVIHSFRLFL